MAWHPTSVFLPGIPMEEPGGLQSMGSQRVGHDWVTKHSRAHQSFQWIFRVDFLQDLLVWSPCSPRDSQESSPGPQFKNTYSLVLRLFYGPILTSRRDYWKNHNFKYINLAIPKICPTLLSSCLCPPPFPLPVIMFLHWPFYQILAILSVLSVHSASIFLVPITCQ